MAQAEFVLNSSAATTLYSFITVLPQAVLYTVDPSSGNVLKAAIVEGTGQVFTVIINPEALTPTAFVSSLPSSWQAIALQVSQIIT